MTTLRCLPVALSLICGPLFADQNLAGNVTITGGAATGNLTVTGTIDSEGNVVTFGTQGSGFGGALLHQDNSTDTFTFFSNRNPASWLWQHSVGIAAMRLDVNHQLILYQADGATAGVTLAPASNSIKLGTHANGTLTADANGVITAGGGFAVAGGIANTNGSLTGGASGLTLNAGGTNQNITLSSSAAGDIVFNTNGVERARINSVGNVGIGTSTPSAGLTVSTEGLNYTDGSYFLVGSTNSTFGGGATLAGIKTAAVDGGNYNFLKLQNAAGTKFLINGAGNVGIGTTDLGAKLSVAGSIRTPVSGGQAAIVPSLFGPAHAGIAFSYDPNSEGIVAYGYNFGSNPVFRVAAKPYIADSLAAWDPTSTTRLLVTADGNVGIGTTTPSARLQVVGGNARFSAVSEAWSEGIRIEVARNSWGGVRFYRGDANFNGNWAIGYKSDSTDDFVFTNNDGGTQSDRLVLTKTGNIGIGTTAPSTKLDVVGPTAGEFGATFGIGLKNSDYQRALGNNSGAIITGRNNANNDGQAGMLFLGSAYSTEVANKDVGVIDFLDRTSGKSDANAGSKAMIFARTAGSGGSTGGYGGKLHVGVRPDNSTTDPWENLVLTVDSSNVGIGTTAPTSKLHIAGNRNAFIVQDQVAAMPDGNSYDVGGIIYNDGFLRDTAGSNPAAYLKIRSINTNSSWPTTIRGTQLEFGTADGAVGQGTQAVMRLAITPAGNVGIGTAAPTEKLEVAGNLKVTGTFSATNYTTTSGTITGGNSGLAFNAGGTNQNITLSPSGTGGVSVNSNDVTLVGTSPTVTFKDPDGRTGYWHVNSNKMYLLSAPQGAGYGAWAQVNGRWPLEFDLNSNFASFGGNASFGSSVLVNDAIVNASSYTDNTAFHGSVVSNSGIGALLDVSNGGIWAQDLLVLRRMVNGGTAPAVGLGASVAFTLDAGSAASHAPETAARISSVLTATNGTNNSSALTFSTATLGSLSEKLRIDSSGNVGIGTMAPTEKIQLSNNSYIGLMANSGTYIPTAWNRGNAGGIIFASSQNADGSGWAYGSRLVNHDYGDGLGLSFDVLNGAAWTNDAFVISGRNGKIGNIGIGTTSPLTKLHIVGDVSVTNSGNGIHLANGYDNGWFGVRLVGEDNGVNGHDLKIKGRTSSTGAFSDLVTVKNAGNVGIGTANPTHKLAVAGTIRAQEIIVDNTNWADYVFEEDYRLAPLAEVESHIKEKGHLPGIPSATEVAEHGVSMGEMQSKLLSKVEELTLHLIAQEKEIAALKTQNASFQEQLAHLKATQP